MPVLHFTDTAFQNDGAPCCNGTPQHQTKITLTSLVHVNLTAKQEEIKVQRELQETLPVFLGPGVFPSSTSASAVPAMYSQCRQGLLQSPG